MTPLIPHVRAHFDLLADRLATFDHHECQVEGWLKGELIHFLHTNAERLGVTHVDREVVVDGGRVDVVAQLREGRTLWFELKHWRIGMQRGARWTFTSTVKEPSAFGLLKDIAKLTSERCRGGGYALLLFTANPGVQDWTEGLRLLNARLGPTRVEPMSSPSDYPPSYFLGVLRAV